MANHLWYPITNIVLKEVVLLTLLHFPWTAKVGLIVLLPEVNLTVLGIIVSLRWQQ